MPNKPTHSKILSTSPLLKNTYPLTELRLELEGYLHVLREEPLDANVNYIKNQLQKYAIIEVILNAQTKYLMIEPVTYTETTTTNSFIQQLKLFLSTGDWLPDRIETIPYARIQTVVELPLRKYTPLGYKKQLEQTNTAHTYTTKAKQLESSILKLQSLIAAARKDDTIQLHIFEKEYAKSQMNLLDLWLSNIQRQYDATFDNLRFNIATVSDIL